MEKAINMLQRLRVLGNVSLQYAYSQRHQLEKWYSLAKIHGLAHSAYQRKSCL